MSSKTMSNYARLPIALQRGQGALVWDTDGKEYLDAVSGVAVCNLGHAHPAVAEALCQQAQTLIHTSNLYQIPLQETLADKLCELSTMDAVFFANSGAEANEAAIKLARLHGHQLGIEHPLIIVTEKSFHGRTLATLSATGNRKVQAGFEPLVQGFVRVPYNDLRSVESIMQANSNVVAVLVEPVQGEGGVNIPDADYLSRLRQLCDQHQALLMLDEIQTGMGRTGKWFGFQHSDIQPDVITLAKGLGNGVPIGACLARGNAARLFKPGSHGSTFGGNPLACAAANAVIDTIRKEDLVSQVNRLADTIIGGFTHELADQAGVVAIRNQGLLIGIELDRSAGTLVQQAIDAGVLINVTADKVVRLLPPFIMNQTQAEHLVKTVSRLIKQLLEKNE
ncbi:MAG: acetylornithine transaminase [Gammaproteobacteria bacterium]|nr:acetylornithine transaminase [Gammaproteobacteria bacterium]